MDLARRLLACAVWVWVWVWVAAGPSLLADPPADALKKEWAKLEGTWELVRPEGATDAAMRLEFKAGKLSVVWVGMGDLPAEARLHLDTDPPCIDIEFKVVRRESYEGIYKIEGDTLYLALAPSDVKERPTKFPDKMEPGNLFGTFKRSK